MKRNCKLRTCLTGRQVADCGFNGNGNNVGATSRAASVSASGTPTGGNGKTQDGNRPAQFQICDFKFQIEQQEETKRGQDVRGTCWRDARDTKNGGTVLIIMLVIVSLAAMTAASLLFRMHAELSASQVGNQGEQAYSAAFSGIRRAMEIVKTPSEDWQDNPALLADQYVCDDGANKWYFTVFAASEDGKTIRYGLECEAGKININTADARTLKALLSHVPAAADVSVDELVNNLMIYTGRAGGGDASSQPTPPYAVKGGPLATREELLLVQGFTGPVVYGEDANLNGVLDPNEDDGEASFPPDESDGVLDTGLIGMTTVLTHEQNVDNSNNARININGTPDDLKKLDGAGLDKATVDFINAYRAEGNMFVHPSQLLDMEYTPKKPVNTAPASDNNNNNATGTDTGGTSATQPGKAQDNQPVKSGVTADNLGVVLDRLTTSPSAGRRGQLIGLVNVNAAPASVLACLPGMDDDTARAICAARIGLDGSKKNTVAWLVSENLLSAEKFKEVAPYLTARGMQYRIRCIGYGVPCGRYMVLEAIVDIDGGRSRIAYLRNITRLGLPVAINADHAAQPTKVK